MPQIQSSHVLGEGCPGSECSGRIVVGSFRSEVPGDSFWEPLGLYFSLFGSAVKGILGGQQMSFGNLQNKRERDKTPPCVGLDLWNGIQSWGDQAAYCWQVRALAFSSSAVDGSRDLGQTISLSGSQGPQIRWGLGLPGFRRWDSVGGGCL